MELKEIDFDAKSIEIHTYRSFLKVHRMGIMKIMCGFQKSFSGEEVLHLLCGGDQTIVNIVKINKTKHSNMCALKYKLNHKRYIHRKILFNV